jgi:hypothetical protein
MDTSRRTRYRKAMWGCLVAVVALALVGCEMRPALLSARSHSEAQEEVVQVTLRSADAESIKRRQMHFSLVIVNCTGAEDRYPAEARISGQRIDEFRYPTEGDTVQITGRIPSGIFARYGQPCVLLQGGGYFTGTIKSSRVPIDRR